MRLSFFVAALMATAPALATGVPGVIGPASTTWSLYADAAPPSGHVSTFQSGSDLGVHSFDIAAGIYGRAATTLSPIATAAASVHNSTPFGEARARSTLAYDFAVAANSAGAAQALRDYFGSAYAATNVVNGSGTIIGNDSALRVTGYYSVASQGQTSNASVQFESGFNSGYFFCDYDNPCSSGGYSTLARLDYATPLIFTGHIYLSAYAYAAPGDDTGASAFIDPFVELNFGSGFTGNAGDYTLSFSPGVVNATGPLPVAGVPEPATWALLLGGFGLSGVALRRRQSIEFGI